MSQASGIEALLNRVRKTLKDLGDSVDHLESTYPDIFENSDLALSLDNFRTAHQEATERLKIPRLSIAMIGTTSSGKSTIVNALIGRKLAPIEAGEMSGGVLTLRHADESRLIVEATEGAIWETGDWTNLTDEEMYDRIRDGVMRPYHQARRKRSKSIIAAPQVTAFGPLLPAINSSLLGLPPGLGIEFIDLPGLKSVQDRTNLSVIQERVQKAFSLVALDYMQVDDDHRRQLLAELKEVVSFLRGRTDSMLFILNRIDQRGFDDLPLSERLDSLRQEIKQELNLKELPDILPFSGRLLYYAQCAKGPGGTFSITAEKRLAFLKAMFQDCASEIKSRISGNKELRRWIQDIENQIDDGECVGEEDLDQLLNYAYEWSGGKEIWSRLSQSLKESFPELVLLPALLHLFKSYDALSTSIDTIASIRQLKYKEQVESEQEKIVEIRKRLAKEIKSLRRNFRDGITEMIQDLKDNTIESIERVSQRAEKLGLAQKAEKLGLSGFQSIGTAVVDVEGDLAIQIITPMRDALIKNQPRHEIEEVLIQAIPPNLAEDLARAYDVASRRLSKFTEDGDYLIRRVLSDDFDEVKDLDEDEKSVRKLFLLMRHVLTTRAEFKIQTKAQELEAALAELIHATETQLMSLCEGKLSNSTIGEAIIADYNDKKLSSLPSLPSKFFEIAPNIKRGKDQESKIVGKEWVTTYESGTCFQSEKRRSVQQDKTKLFEYKTVIIPNINAMAEAWQAGVEKGKNELWDVLCQWMTQRLDLASDQFSESTEKIMALIEEVLQEQLQVINEDYDSEMKRWNSIKELKNHSASLKSLLKQDSMSF